MKSLLLFIGLTLAAPIYAAQDLFDVLTQDPDLITDIRAEGNDVWIKLAPSNLSDQITVRISNENKDFYRPWFTKDLDLVSTGFRGEDAWTDRVQTGANFIEYWHNDNLVLHLKRK
jgi:hypothetical protein